MTFPDDSRDEPGKGAPDGHDLPLDEDAAWRAIVDNYGSRPELGTPSSEPDAAPEEGSAGPSAAEGCEPTPTEPAGPSVFDRSYLDAQAAEDDRARASWADEGHFVPPEPPPVPRTTPARRLAWAGLFGAPALMLLAVVVHLTFPTWLSLGLVAAFVGGFVFLVATMERPGGDGWGGDDGAVV
jgi:hypothetical protein